MDGSVYSPGAGHLPRVLAGRDELLQAVTVRLNNVATTGRVRSDDLIYTGIRGVGKTAMLTAYASTAAAQGFEVISHQAVAGQSGLVQAVLSRAQQRIDEGAGAWKRAKRAFDRVAGVSLGVGGVSAGLNLRDRDRPNRPVYPEVLAAALATLAEEVRRDHPTGGVLITIDEVQVASAADLPLLAATLHRLNVDHPAAAVAFAGSGLPHVPTVLREAGVTHPDRLFLIERLPPTLRAADAMYAIIEPARRAGVMWEPAAAELVVRLSNGYPAHLQLFADQAWLAAAGPRSISVSDVQMGIARAGARLADQSFEPRLGELSGRQLEYLTAVALCGGNTSTKAVAQTLGREHKELSWLRDELLRAGDIHSPGWGRVVMSMPAFGPYLLAHYEQARDMQDVELLPLSEMRQLAGPTLSGLRAAGAPNPPAAEHERARLGTDSVAAATEADVVLAGLPPELGTEIRAARPDQEEAAAAQRPTEQPTDRPSPTADQDHQRRRPTPDPSRQG